MTTQKPAILVLCTGNSARSQMAQCYFDRELGERFQVHSAGTEPGERIHPMTVEVLAEAGFDVSKRRPQGYRDFLGTLPVHTLVLVCDGAAKSCPSVWPGVHERLIWPFEDPAAFVGSADETRAKFREVRDLIAERVAEYARAQSL
ncbi:MAG: arsenate reductase ArsC [Acidobacteriota bacterium]